MRFEAEKTNTKNELKVLKMFSSVTWSVKMIRAFSILIVVDAVRLNGREGQVNVLSVENRSAVVILRLDVLQQLINSNVRGKVLRVGPENVEQLLVNRMSRAGRLRVLILAGVRAEESWPRLLRLRVVRPNVVAKVHIIFIVIVR